MKQLAAKSTKTDLIWLVSIALIFSLGMGAENGATVSLRHLKQTELRLTSPDQNVANGSRFLTPSFAKPASYFTIDNSFYSYILHQTQEVTLKQKLSETHSISYFPKIGRACNKIALSTDNDHASLKG